jgi:hypothetical protein
MKTRLLGALVGLAISFALPTFAQQTNKPDPQLRERLIISRALRHIPMHLIRTMRLLSFSVKSDSKAFRNRFFI